MVLSTLDKECLTHQDWIRANPKAWIQSKTAGLGVEHWWEGMDRMTEAWLRGIKERKPIVIGSGHALSKDFLNSGCLPLWFMNGWGPMCKVAMTAPTDRQVKKVMWAELTARYNGSVLKDNFGRMLVCNLQVTENWFVIAFTTKETGGSVGKFQGFHTPAICVIISEAQAVSDSIYEQVDGILASDVQLYVVLGNPVRTVGKYVRMLKDKKRNIVLTLSSLDSPNVIAGKEVIPGMCPKAWVEDKRDRWDPKGTGKDPRWQGRVLGLVPTTSVDNIVSQDLYDLCIDRELYQTVKRGSIGVDPARFGDDDMVICVKESGVTIDTIILPKCDAVEGAGAVVKAQKKYFPEGQIAITVDCDGLGGPYLDNVKHMVADELEINFVEFHGGCTDREIVSPEYHNLRAEAHFFKQEQMKDKNDAFPYDELTEQEATEITYHQNLKGKILAESKDDLKDADRLGHSPNRWDAEVLATWGMKFAPIIKTKDRWKERSNSMAPKGSSHMGA